MDCYICFEKILETVVSSQQELCSCKGSIALHKECFEMLLDSGFEFCSICGDRYKNIDPPLIWKKEKDIYLAEVVIRKNGKKSVYKIDKLGRIQGECNVYFLKRGAPLFMKSYYKDGKLEGKNIEYYEPLEPLVHENPLKNSVLRESYFKNGVPNGLCRFYFRNSGSGESEGFFRTENLSSQDCYGTEVRGPKERSSQDCYGSLCEECFYVDGVMEGLCQSFYRSSASVQTSRVQVVKPEKSEAQGSIKERKFYKAGKLDGKFQEFDKLGRITLEGLYEADVKKGVWKSYTYF